MPLTFKVDPGSNPYYLAVAIEYPDGEGDLDLVELKESGSDSWLPMQQLWGALWKLNSGSFLQAPLSIRITEGESRRILEAENAIPRNWQPGGVYRSVVNF